jgi:hypothetical protein
MTQIDWTGGEVRALISPLFGLEIDEVTHFAILIWDDMQGKPRMIGCKDAPKFFWSIMAPIHDFDPAQDYHSHKRKRWLEVPVLRMLLRRPSP